MRYHLIAFVLGYILDLILGDPYCLPHPIRLIGTGIGKMENRYLGPKGQEKDLPGQRKRKLGRRLVLIILLSTIVISGGILISGYMIHPYLGILFETIMTYQILATKCLKVESMKVYKALKTGTLEEARFAVSMIVGRDTNVLDEIGVAKAAIETVAENTSDGVIAPMLYTALGGPILGFFYKAVNTCDSMIAYKNERYLDFGRGAAKLDDVLNYMPARISAFLMLGASAFMGKNYSVKNGYRIFKRDRYNHASPNSAQTESVCAGVLGIQLAGDASYFGKIVKKPYIGDSTREVNYEDIKKANVLLYGTSILSVTILSFILAVLTVLI